MNPGAIRVVEDGVEVQLLVVPRASRSRVIGMHGDRIKVQLVAPPVDGAANAELVAVLAELLDVPRRSVTIVRGDTNKRKTVRIEAGNPEAIRRALEGT